MHTFWQCVIRVIQLVSMAIIIILSHFPVNFFGLKILTHLLMVKVVGEGHFTAKYFDSGKLAFQHSVIHLPYF